MQSKHSRSNVKNDSRFKLPSSNPASLEVIRKEVKAALKKVSSSSSLHSYDGRNLSNVKNNIITLDNHNRSTIIEEFDDTTFEELSAIEELKKARQLRGGEYISPNKKPARVGVAQVGLSDIR